MTEIYDRYQDRVAFYIVYIREAHAIGSAAPNTFGMVEDPITEIERAELASKCVDDLDLPMPAVVDQMDDAANRAYRGWPDRLYLVDSDGRIAYAGGRGPFFFAPDDWERAIERLLAQRADGERQN